MSADRAATQRDAAQAAAAGRRPVWRGRALRTAALFTLGCKLNQFETEQIREQLEAAGFEIVPWGEKADLYIINSCTVTGKADRDTRRLARHVKRLNPDAVVIVTGCYAEVNPEALRAIPEIDLVIGNAGKASIGQLFGAPPAAQLYGGTGPPIGRFSGHTRAFVKVQEGCNAYCAYCIIPRARGRPRSVPLPEAIDQVKRLLRAGYREIVLIGTHLGQYGVDLSPPSSLDELVARLCEIPGTWRLRLSSIEPREVTDFIVKAVSDGGRVLQRTQRELTCGGRVCRHLHIPMQSGSTSVLQRMRRPYDAEFYASLIERIKRACPDCCVGADVLVGFPGETEEEFEDTVELVRRLPLSYLHVFTFSPRPGTEAAEMPNQVPPEIRKKRNHVLRQISEEKWRAFVQSQIGQVLEVLVEKLEHQHAEGVADNYVRVRFTPPAGHGEMVLVRVTDVAEGEILSGVREE